VFRIAHLSKDRTSVKKVWHLYMLQCAKGAYYTGISPDVKERVKKHNEGKGAKAVRALGLPAKLAYQEEVGSYPEALRRERAMKRLSHNQKADLVEEHRAR